MNKKILFVSSSIYFYENFLYETIFKIKQKNKIYIVTNIKDKSLNFNKIHLKNINFSRSINPFKDLIDTFKLALLIKSLKPNIIISSTPKGSMITTLANFFFQIPRIHILTGILWSDTNYNFLNKFSKFIDLITIKFSKKIFLDSKSQIDFLLNHHFPKDKLSLIANGSMKGVNLNKFKFNRAGVQIKKKKLNFSKKSLILLYLGRISPEKGIETFISSIIEIAKEGYDIKGLIVGSDEKNILKKYIKKNKDFNKYFKHLKYSKEPESFLQLADILLIPSSREGFCQVAIEASACEVPIVGFDVIGLKDSIKKNKTGYLVPFNDKVKFKEKVKLLLNDRNLRRKMGKNGRKFVKLKYNEKKVLKQFAYQLKEIFQKL